MSTLTMARLRHEELKPNIGSRILNTKEQVELYRKTQGEIRGLRNAKRKELTKQKASKEAIESAVLAIYAE